MLLFVALHIQHFTIALIWSQPASAPWWSSPLISSVASLLDGTQETWYWNNIWWKEETCNTSFASDWTGRGCGCCCDCGEGGPGIPGTLGTTVTGLTSWRQRHRDRSTERKLVFGRKRRHNGHTNTQAVAAGSQSFLISQPHYVGWPVILWRQRHMEMQHAR